jgi:DNA-binding NarL/FixJ family response regulator
VRQHCPDVLILDLLMPELDGLGVLRELAREKDTTAVILLTARIEEDVMIDAIRLGARGVLLKHMEPRLVIQCVRKVHAGGEWLEQRAVSHALRRLVRDQVGQQEAMKLLTPREIELVRLVARGLRNRALADQLHISEGTVKVHLHHVFEKLGLDNRVALVVWARDRGLV